MGKILFQAELTTTAQLDMNENVVFDNVITTSGDILYNSGTGEFLISQNGGYKVEWWVSVQSNRSTNGTGFVIVTTDGLIATGNSQIHTNQVNGFAILNVDDQPVSFRLRNNSAGTLYIGTDVPVKASIAIYGDDYGTARTADLCLMTTMMGNIDTNIVYGEGGGNLQAVAGIVFTGDLDVREITRLSCFVVQVGAVNGNFQMALLEATSHTTAEVIAVTNMVTSVSAGLFTLPLTSSITVMGEGIYYFAVYNQVNACEIGAVHAGTGAVNDAYPINFRVQNLASGFTIGDMFTMSDVSLVKTPWVAGLT